MSTPRIPPAPDPVPLAPDGDERAVLLGEVGEAEGAALGALLDAVRLWAERRRPVFAGEAAARARRLPEVGYVVEALERLMEEEAPDADSGEAVGLGCHQVAEWAERRGAVATALAWMQAALAAWPRQPFYAYHVGRLARKRAAYPQAEAWLRYAVRLARRAARWEIYALGLAGIANLHRQRGNLRMAERFHRLSLKTARRHGLRTMEGDALYDLAVLAIDVGDVRRAVDRGREALQAYGPEHSRVYRLAHDFAWCMMNEYGAFEQAAHVFQALLEHVWEQPFRLLVVANLCRAAAGAGWTEVFEEAWVQAWISIGHMVDREEHAGAMLQLTLAAATISSWDRVRLAAGEAIKVAKNRNEDMVLARVQDVLDLIDDSSPHQRSIQRTLPDLRWFDCGGDRRHHHATEVISGFAVDLTGAMRARKDEGPARPRGADLLFATS